MACKLHVTHTHSTGGALQSFRPVLAYSEVERKAVQSKVGNSPLLDCGQLAIACCVRLALVGSGSSTAGS